MNSHQNAWILIIIAGVNTCIANLLLKKSRLEAIDSSLFSLIFSPWLIAGLFFFGVNVLLFTKALDNLPVSAAYPVLAGLGFSLLAITSSWFYGEQLGLNQWVGIGLILGGLIVMTRS